MISLGQIWVSLTSPVSQVEEDARRERMTRVIFVMTSAGLLLMSMIIAIFDFSVGEPTYTPSLIMLFIDGLMAIGWILIYRGRWYISRYMLPTIFLGLGSYFVFNVGPITTGVLQFAIAAILTSMLFKNAAQWVTVAISLALYLTVGWLSGERDFEIFFTGGVVIGASLSGIALLQWFSYAMLETSLKKIRHAEVVSRETAGKIRAIFESIRDGLTITDLEGTIIDLNEATVRLHAFDHKDELLGHNALELIAKQEHPKAMENLLLTLKNGHSGLLEYKFLTKNNQEFDGELNAVLIVDANGNPAGFVALTRDITSRKKAETERETLIQKLEEKNTELENFAYTVSHDLKSPLITVSGFLGYLEKDILSNDTEKVRKDIEWINQAIGKMNDFLAGILELSRIGRLMNPPEDVSFGEIVQEALGNLKGQLDRGKIKVEVGSEFPVVHGDRLRLVEVVQNLVDNATKFTGEQAEPKIQIGVIRNGNENTFFVRDNGVGIAPEYHERIFGLFNKLDRNSSGTGIGLSLVKRIIEVHGGRIWVESEVGKGATFFFALPGQPKGKG